MQAFLLTMFCSVTLGDYLMNLLGLPGIIKFIPEMCSAAATVYVVLAGTRQRFQFVAAKYWLVFGALAVVILCGIAANHVDTGPIVAGMRNYLRALPFFFLAAVFAGTEQQLGKQLGLLLLLGMTQVPIAIYQRSIVMSEGRFSGDSVRGTVGASGILSMFLLCAVMILTAYALRGRIKNVWFILCFFLLLIPTAINETKVIIVMLPIGLLITMMIGSPPGKRLRIVAWAAVLLVGFGAVFVPLYNMMQVNNPYGGDITEFLSDKERVEAYMGSGNSGVGATKLVGRTDAIAISFDYISKEPVRLIMGLGMGNASSSALGKNFSGKYDVLFNKVAVISAFSTFALEIGMVGLGLIFLFHWMVFRDALVVARSDSGIHGAVAVGWTGIVAIMVIGIFYLNAHISEALAYLYFYLSGVIAAQRMRLALVALREKSADQYEARMARDARQSRISPKTSLANRAQS